MVDSIFTHFCKKIICSLLLAIVATIANAQIVVSVNGGSSQQVLEGTTATVDISLSQAVGEEPIILEFALDPNDASRAEDFQFINNPLTISSGDSAELMLSIVDDETAEFAEPVRLILTTVSNAIIGVDNEARLIILGGNVQPDVDTVVEQNSVVSNTVLANDGNVVMTANVTDLNSDDTHTFIWSSVQILSDTTTIVNAVDASGMETDETVVVFAVVLPRFEDSDSDTRNFQFVFDPNDATSTSVQSLPPVGLVTDRGYFIDVTVTDSGGLSNTERINFFIADTLPANVNNRNDDDGDGIVNDFDNTINATNPIGVMETITAETGVNLEVGFITRVANLGYPDDIVLSALDASEQQIPEDINFTQVSNIIDFQAQGHFAGDRYKLVMPVPTGIPENAVMRVFDPLLFRWLNLIDDNTNAFGNIISIPFPANSTNCPAPNSPVYQQAEMVESDDTTTTVTVEVLLRTNDNCIEFTVIDGSQNDTDASANGTLGIISALSVPRVLSLDIQTNAAEIVDGSTQVVTITAGDTLAVTVTALNGAEPVEGIEIDIGLTNLILSRTPPAFNTETVLTNDMGEISIMFQAVSPGTSTILVSAANATATVFVSIEPASVAASDSGSLNWLLLGLLLSLGILKFYRENRVFNCF